MRSKKSIPKIRASVNDKGINLTISFTRCRPVQIQGKSEWVLVECDRMANFKVEVEGMEIQPKIICRVILSAHPGEGKLFLTRQEADAATFGEQL